MKRLITALILATLSTTALADGRGHGHHGYRGNNSGGDVLIPLIVGGTIGYIIAQPRQQTVVAQQPVNLNQSYGASQPIYEYQDIYFEDCGCMKRVLIKIN
jgi:hypothetical protein